MTVSNRSRPKLRRSDSGGIAGRRGYKYQDHVAAHFVLKMIEGAALDHVECETADDIVLVGRQMGKATREYVQVKTTDGDKKYSTTELLERVKEGRPTSLAEKSLLCDADDVPETVKFRIFSRRDVNKTLTQLKLPFDARDPGELVKLAKRLFAKWKTQSSNGHNLEYWGLNTTWQVFASMDGLEASNQMLLSHLADSHGYTPTHSHIQKIYKSLLNLVISAAEASKVTNEADKTITKVKAISWWEAELETVDAERRNSAKPYRIKTSAFFADLHVLTEDEIMRALTGLDARYERKVWRSKQLAKYLSTWLPEVALKASELPSINQLNMAAKLEEAVEEISRRSDITPEILLAEVLLHSVIRHCFKSEPIACKVFYQSKQGLKGFRSAHIVKTAADDQLWLGCATVATLKEYPALLRQVTSEVAEVLDPDFLKRERKTILSLREPAHLLPTTLEKALAENSPVDDLLKVLCVPLLVGYDSATLGKGFSADYESYLKDEVEAEYESIKSLLPDAAEEVRVHIFLIPIECVKTLTGQFAETLNG